MRQLPNFLEAYTYVYIWFFIYIYIIFIHTYIYTLCKVRQLPNFTEAYMRICTSHTARHTHARTHTHTHTHMHTHIQSLRRHICISHTARYMYNVFSTECVLIYVYRIQPDICICIIYIYNIHQFCGSVWSVTVCDIYLYIHTYIRTYIHTYVHTYNIYIYIMHTYTCDMWLCII